MKNTQDLWLRGLAAAGARFDRHEGLDQLAASPEECQRLQEQARDLQRGWHNDLADNKKRGQRIADLRAHLAQCDLDGFLIPHNDEYHNEYLPLAGQRLYWLTGFSGSAGFCIVLRDGAAVWSDGRYTLQLATELDATIYEKLHITDQPPTAWLAAKITAGMRIGFDPWLHTPASARRWRETIEACGASLIAVDQNPIDAIWQDKPPAPLAPFLPHDLIHAGETAESKRQRLAHELKKSGLKAAVLTAPDSIAWLLNIRSADVNHTPIGMTRALLFEDGQVDLFVDGRKIGEDLRRHLGNAVALRSETDLMDRLKTVGQGGARVRLDELTATEAVRQTLEAAGARIEMGADPCQLPKACKNAVEMDGARAAHLRDGAAMVKFLHWLMQEAPSGRIDELTASQALLQFRQETGCLIDLSFPPISGAGPNGAIVHYRASAASNRRLGLGELYLIDSGGQYLDGTTDITRTVAIGEPTTEMRTHFTAVLRGHIALACAVFPHGTTGSHLDSLARQYLWRMGLDYDHGTGHGVGSFLSVHEGPARISKLPNSIALRPGMILSNEPGYYKTGAYGIRIENLLLVRDEPRPDGAERDLLGFETLTLAPIDRRLVRSDLLRADERDWLNGYHARVRTALSPLLPEPVRAWLAEETAPL